MSINLAAGDNYMSNMDLPPSSSDEEETEAEESTEDGAGNQTDGHAQPDAAELDDASSSRSNSQSRNAGFNSTAEEGCKGPEAHYNDQWLSARQTYSEPTIQADDALSHALHGNLPNAGQLEDGSNSAQSTHARSLQTSLEHLHMT